MTRFIGDVHGRYDRYKKVIKDCPVSVQVGDMGVGFRRYYVDGRDGHGDVYGNPPFDHMKRGNHRFIRGNHDNPDECRKHPMWIPDGTVEDDVMYVGGGLSIDKAYRIPGFSWWEDEELSGDDLTRIGEVYDVARPGVMVTHEAPESVACTLTNRLKLEYPSRTRRVFQEMFDTHQPKVWIFGHWHQSFDQTISGTRFVCLNELEYLDLDLSSLQESPCDPL